MTKKEIVIKYITNKIKKEEWKIGERIPSEPNLALEIGVSRMSIREAIEKLANENILLKKHGSGTYVNEVIPKVIFNNVFPSIELKAEGYREILEVRLALEPLALELSMKGNSKKLEVELKKIINKMKKNFDKKEFIDNDMEFHSCIAKYSGNEFLFNLINTAVTMLKFHKKKNEYLSINNLDRIVEHLAIYESIKSNEVEISKLYLQRHLQKAIEKIS